MVELCWSPTHYDQPPASERGFHTCSHHRNEEGHIVRILDELNEAERKVALYERVPSQRHAARATLVEDAVRTFFDQEIARWSRGVLVRGGTRRFPGQPEEQLDVIATLDPDDGWSASLTLLPDLQNADLLLHCEITYRDSDSDLKRKFREDTAKLLKSVRNAVDRGAHLPFTVMVLVGPAWHARELQLMALLHELHHEQPPGRTLLGGELYWPAIDAVVFPDRFYKKHDFFTTNDLQDSNYPRWLGYSPYPTTGDNRLRPLAVARAFLPHRLEIRAGRSKGETPAWPREMDAGILGPLYRIDLRSMEPFYSVMLRDIEPERTCLWHLGADLNGSVVSQRQSILRDHKCTREAFYVIEPKAMAEAPVA
ncbi:MAG: hypothetical protein IT379_15035 [Deltaproteobacteria bacterium]|nr:hypothetical protein [Deltaproteobacteria bacterium]